MTYENIYVYILSFSISQKIGTKNRWIPGKAYFSRIFIVQTIHTGNRHLKQLFYEENLKWINLKPIFTTSYRTQKKIAWKSIFFRKKILSDSFETLYTYVIADEEFFERGLRPKVAHWCSRDWF